MQKRRFTIILLLSIFALVLLIAVETLWAIRGYRAMSENHKQQIESIMEAATQQYVSDRYSQNGTFNIASIDRYKAIMSEELHTSGFDIPFIVEVLATTDGDPVVLMSDGCGTLGKERMSVDVVLTPIVLRLTIDAPHAEIMRGMRDMLLMQIVAVLVLIVTVVYLLRTIFKAKSMDAIRRDFTHNMTHELKTPIAAAMASTDALRSVAAIAEDKQQRDDYLNMTHAELQRLNRMVEELLRSSTEEFKYAELRPEECRISEVVEMARASVSLQYSIRNVVWSIDIDDSATVVADRFHLESMVVTLLDNAIKYCDKEPHIVVRANVNKGYSIIEVEDNGIGIERKDCSHIFDKFYRANRRLSVGGFGLGLYYVKSIVERHGGAIAVRSKVGCGSCFTIKLPRYGK